MHRSHTAKTAAIPIVFCGLCLAASSLLLLLLSHHQLSQAIVGLSPIFWLVGIGMTGGVIYLMLCGYILRWGDKDQGIGYALIWLLLVGLAMRLLMLPSTPMLENDYFRYLWDGAVTAAGQNPFAHAPGNILQGDAPTALRELARESDGLLERVTYPVLRSIYPPVAQASFLLANWLEPWSLMAWRAVILAFDLISLGLLVAILRRLGRPVIWSALYWCNPLLVKEFFNSAHMDAVLVPFLLATLLLALKSRTAWASVTLALAAGCKVWPVLLLPSLLRPLAARWRQALAPLLIFGTIISLLATPILWAGFSQDSGFVAYAQSWQRNDALFGLIAWLSAALLDVFSLTSLDAARIARFAIALVIVSVAVGINRDDIREPAETARRFLFIAALLFLLSPTQYPWYYSWLLPFLVIQPSIPLLLMTALLPLYYLRFVFEANEFAAITERVFAWIQFGPVLGMLAWQWLASRKAGGTLTPIPVRQRSPET
ncbi:glycosyltransferase 87 family protein [Denitrobaculum tricleocarpae]|uniref:DUF2029 domain-containing protein n=1 Tax=Denitrobaculum tricleocarpae TaxID=2591009 RepID=A0A545TTU1_9PROT|nr:glycosyltransferase 87 family protein [Denitrobaculum tricleocarpae]TQV80637.1 DUF2029 domain-containing protein [Denitrobaculum tricleocarpae]